MTVENSILRLEAYKKNAEDESLSAVIRKQSQMNYDNMKEHILNSKKFIGNPIIDELTEKPKKSKKTSKEEKEE